MFDEIQERVQELEREAGVVAVEGPSAAVEAVVWAARPAELAQELVRDPAPKLECDGSQVLVAWSGEQEGCLVVKMMQKMMDLLHPNHAVALVRVVLDEVVLALLS